MDDEVAATNSGVDAFVALDVSLDELDLVGERQQVAAAAAAEVVEDPDVVAVVQEPFGQTLTFTYDAVGNRTSVTDPTITRQPLPTTWQAD